MSSAPIHARKTISHYSQVESFFPMACVVVDDNISYGSGFLIAPDLIITNYHVYEEVVKAGDANLAKCHIRFMCEKENGFREVKLHTNWNWIEKNVPYADVVPLSKNPLDYIILHLAEEVDKDVVFVRSRSAFSEPVMTDRRWICLFDENAVSPELKVGTNVYVVHHPAVSVEFEGVEGWIDSVDGPALNYKFDRRNPTQGGSSGALCVSAVDWRVIAMHQTHLRSNSKPEETKRGISITKIAEDLGKRLSPDYLNYLRVQPKLARTFSVSEDLFKERVQELVDLLEPLTPKVSDEQRYVAYLLALPPSIDPQNNSLHGIISHLDNLKTGRYYSMLDFLIILEKLYDLDLFSEELIREWVEKALKEEENIYDLLSLSKARADEYLKKRTINIYVDIERGNDSTTIYAPKIYLELMGKSKVCISDSTELSGIKKKEDFIQKLQEFWSRKINNLLVALEPQLIQIEFGVNQDTLGWDIGRSELNLQNPRGRYKFRIGEEFPYIYRSLERRGFASHMEALKGNLNSKYQESMFGIDGIPVRSKDEFCRVIVKERKIICVYSSRVLSKPERKIVYNSILNMGIPGFVWLVSKENIFDLGPFQDFTSLDDFRNWLSVVQMDDRKFFDVLFDDPQHLLKFKDEGDSHV